MFNYQPPTIQDWGGPEVTLCGYLRIADTIYGAYEVGYTDYDTWDNHYQAHLVSWDLSGTLISDSTISQGLTRTGLKGIINIGESPVLIKDTTGSYMFLSCQNTFTYGIKDGYLEIYGDVTLPIPETLHYRDSQCAVDSHQGQYICSASIPGQYWCYHGDTAIEVSQSGDKTSSFVFGYDDFIYVGYYTEDNGEAWIDKIQISTNYSIVETTNVNSLPTGFVRMKKIGAKAVICGCWYSAYAGNYGYSCKMFDAETNTLTTVGRASCNVWDINNTADCIITDTAAVSIYASDSMVIHSVSISGTFTDTSDVPGGGEEEVVDLSSFQATLLNDLAVAATVTLKARIDGIPENIFGHIKIDIFEDAQCTSLITSKNTLEHNSSFKINSDAFPIGGITSLENTKELNCRVFIGPYRQVYVVYSLCKV